MSDAPVDPLLEHVDRLARDMADMCEGHTQPFRISTRSLDNAARAADGSPDEVGCPRREAASLASERAMPANRVEDAFPRAVRADIRLDDLRDETRPGGAV